jgi:tetratricopeptide (TPR) repeat protein
MSPQGFRVSMFVAVAGLMLQPVFGQRGGGTTGTTAGTGGGVGAGAGSTTGTTTGTPSTTRPPTIPNTTQPNTQQQTPQQPIFISGRVLLEDGQPPAESVIIERVCSGAPHSEGYTDSKGYFSIQLGAQNNGVMHDASEDMSGFSSVSPMGGSDGFGGGGLNQSSTMRGSLSPENRYLDCDLRARLAGYRSQSLSLANRRPMDPPDVGVILLHRLSPTEGSTISTTSLAAPKDARKAYEKGMEALKKHKAEDALKDFQKAVEAYPNYAAAWAELGRIELAQGDATMARGSFETAVKSDPKFVSPYMELGIIAFKNEKWQQAADWTEKVVKLDTFDYPQAYFLNAVSNYYLKNMDAAEKSAREAARLDTRKEFPSAIRLLGVLLANKQEYSEAAEQFKAYLKVAPTAADAATVRTQLSQIEQLSAAKQ